MMTPYSMLYFFDEDFYPNPAALSLSFIIGKIFYVMFVMFSVISEGDYLPLVL